MQISQKNSGRKAILFFQKSPEEIIEGILEGISKRILKGTAKNLSDKSILEEPEMLSNFFLGPLRGSFRSSSNSFGTNLYTKNEDFIA